MKTQPFSLAKDGLSARKIAGWNLLYEIVLNSFVIEISIIYV